jgi:two-component system cell cycle sensor histidine kinase/response regulator CckA
MPVMTPVRAQELLVQAQRATAATPAETGERLTRMLAEATVHLRYEIAPAMQLLQEARALAIRLGDTDHQALCLSLLARGEAKTKGLPHALALLEEADQKLGAQAPAAIRGQVDYAGAVIYWAFDESVDAIARLNAAVDAADEAGDKLLQARCQLLVIGILGWPDDPFAAIDHIESLGKAIGDQSILLEAQLLRIHAGVWLGSDPRPILDLERLQVWAQTLGVRVLEGYIAQTLGVMLAHEKPAEAVRLAQFGVEIARKLGDRELLAQGLQRLAEVEMARSDEHAAATAILESTTIFTAMQMPARLHVALETGMRIASAAGDGKAAKAYTEQIARLEAEQNKRPTNQVRFWAETNRMRTVRQKAQEQYERELAQMTTRLDQMLWAGAFGLLGLGSLFAVLLLRSKRRLQLANQRLGDEIRTAQKVQAEREALEQNLNQMERLDSIGLLAGGFAHDFNNILVGVQGNAQLLLADANLAGDAREVLQQIAFAGERAAALCKDILSYARHGGSAREVLDLRDLIRGLLPIARAGFGAGIEVELDLGCEPQLAEVDRAQIEQVFLNVLVNAHDAMGDRGKITIRAQERRLDGTPQSGHWFGEFTGEPRLCSSITIADTGHGMTPETIRRIFDPFFSTRFPGRGIGLAAAYGILRRHHGVVQIHSELEQGSRFSIYLPRPATANTDPPTPKNAAPEPIVELLPRPAPVAPTAPTAKNLPTKGLILIVDDEISVSTVAQRLLERDGFSTLVANSGSAGVALFEQHLHAVSLALVDFTMPDIDGASLCAELRQRRRDLPVVVMSGHDESMVRAAIPEAIFLAKPFPAAALREVVAQALLRLV